MEVVRNELPNFAFYMYLLVGNWPTGCRFCIFLFHESCGL